MFVYCGCKDSENIADKQIIYQKTPKNLRMCKICSNFARKIVLPNSITGVEEHVFVDCSLNSIIVPKGEIQRFAAIEELNFYCGILTEDDNQNLANINTTMMKNIFYGALSFLCITLAICAIVMTCRSKAVVTVKASTGSEEILVNVNSSSVDKAIENAKEIKTTWNEKELGEHYHHY